MSVKVSLQQSDLPLVISDGHCAKIWEPWQHQHYS